MTQSSLLVPVCLLIWALNSASASAQAPPGSLSPSQQKLKITLEAKSVTLDEIAAEVSRVSGCNIIVNDHPIQSKIDVDLSGELAQVLTEVANRFDYEYKITKAGVVLFTKRFKDPKEYPNLTWQEVKKVASDMLGPASAIYIDPDGSRDGGLMAQFNSSITPEQLTQLKSGKVIHVRDLSPLQQGLVRERVYRTLFFGAQDQWREMMTNFQRLPISKVRFGEVKM